jgi:hypothetical protein
MIISAPSLTVGAAAPFGIAVDETLDPLEAPAGSFALFYSRMRDSQAWL